MLLPCSRRPTLRLLLALACTAALLSAPALAQTTAKRPLHHGDYDAWRTIQGQKLSPDGLFVAYALVPQEGDGEIVVRNLKTGSEHRQSRGKALFGGVPTKGPTTPPDGLPGAAALAFTADSRYLVYTVTPTKAEVDKAKATKPSVELARSSLCVLDLATNKVTRITGVKSFQLSEEAPNLLLYQKGEPAPAGTGLKKGGGKAGVGPPEPPKAPTVGSDLVLRQLKEGSERVLPEVVEFSLSKDAKTLIFAVGSKQAENNGLFVLATGTTLEPLPILTGAGRYTRLTWDEKQTQLAFFSSRDDARAPTPKFKMYHWKRAPAEEARKAALHWGVGLLRPGLTVSLPDRLLWIGPAAQWLKETQAVEVVGTNQPGIKKGYALTERGTLSFAADGGKVFFSVAPEKQLTKAAVGEQAVFDLWHWKDGFIQPMQKVRALQEQNRTFQAVYHFADKKCLQIGDETLPTVTVGKDGRWAVGADDRGYRNLVGIDANYADLHLIQTATGARKSIGKKMESLPLWSNGGRFLLFFAKNHWYCLDCVRGQTAMLTRDLKVSFGVDDLDTLSTPPPYGIAGWAKDDAGVLIYDKHDLWLFAPDGKTAKNLTQGLGRQQHLQFRLVLQGDEKKGIDLTKPLLLRAEHLKTHDSGFYRLPADGGAPKMLLMSAKNFSPPAKASKADTLLFTASTFYDFPDLYVANGDFTSLKKVSNANPQKEQLLWGKAELIPFKNTDGVQLSGMLIKPENFDPNKKYPLLVYIYEKLSDKLHYFVNPQPGTVINPAYYASNGYLVFMPDIVYKVGYPGQSALQCVLPGVQAVVDRGCVDEKAIGIQGHSWGGYQIAYMITQTNRFKAASAGAPVANMTSAYSGIRWGTGLPRQFQYEKTQSRIGGSLWQYPTRFIENSPVFMADRVRTPLLMLHNDQDDAVPWYQGIEYFLALRRLEKEVYLFNYNGELHGLRRRANQRDYTVRMQQFFDHHLRGAPQPDWMANGIPFLERDKGK